MEEIIKSHNSSYARYEELINRRDSLKKRSFSVSCRLCQRVWRSDP